MSHGQATSKPPTVCPSAPTWSRVHHYLSAQLRLRPPGQTYEHCEGGFYSALNTIHLVLLSDNPQIITQ